MGSEMCIRDRNNEANIDDRIEFHIFDRFTVQNAIVGAASTQTLSLIHI